MGRPKAEFTERQRGILQGLVLCGVQQEAAAEILGTSVHTLKKHMGKDWADAKAQNLAQLANRVYTIAMDDSDRRSSLVACMFTLKTLAGWRETNHVEMSTPEGKSLVVQFVDAPEVKE